MSSATRQAPEVKLAIELLRLPPSSDHKELKALASDYIKTLGEAEYQTLVEEVSSAERETDRDNDFEAGLELFARLGFTLREAQAYAPMRIDSPGVRFVVARRAVLILKKGRSAYATFYQAKLAEDILTGELSLDYEKMLEILGVREPARIEASMDEIRQAAISLVGRRVWSSRRGKATRSYIRDHQDLIEQYTNTGSISVQEASLPEYVTRSSILLELSQRAKRREESKAVRQWIKDHPDRAQAIRNKVVADVA